MSTRIPTLLATVLALALALPLIATAQLVVPDQVDVGKKIVVTCTTPTPEGSRLEILWGTSDGLDSEQITTPEAKLFVWGPAGEHMIDAVVLPMKEITVDGQTFSVLTGPPQRFKARFTIGEPSPPDPPPPDPTSAPFPSPGFSILILKEASETGRLTEGQRSVLTSPQILKYVNQRAVKLEDEQPAYRAWDDDYSAQQLDNAPKVMREAYALVSAAKTELPWVAISTGKTGWQGPLPNTVDEMLALLRKYGE